MATATFRFHGPITYFLARPPLPTTVERVHSFSWRANAKDMIESLGVPHPEVEAVLANGVAVPFEAIVNDGDTFDVYGRTAANVPPGVHLLRPPLPDPARFILDTHLGRLVSYLRLAGFDTLYRNDYPDDLIARIADEEARIVLTRDVGVLKRSRVTWGYFVRELEPRPRFIEVIHHFGLANAIQPFSRCTRCNGILVPAPVEAVRDKLPENTLRHYSQFFQCTACGQVYWPGSHYADIQAFLDGLTKA